MQEKKDNKWIVFIKSPLGITSVIAIFLTIIIFVYGVVTKDNYRLSIVTEQTGFFINNENNSSVEGKLKVLYNDTEVQNPFYTLLTLKNTGNVPIKEEFFKSDFIMETSNNTRVLDFSFNGKSPALVDEFRNKTSIREDTVIVRPFLLNSGEYITIFIITDNTTVFNYNYRIEGISKIDTSYNFFQQVLKEYSENPFGFIFIIIFVLLPFILSIILLLKIYKTKQRIRKLEELDRSTNM